MANYLKGIGDAGLRINEILPSLDARIYKFIIGHAAGILRGEYNDFTASTIDRGVVIKGGMMQAHGYFASADTDTQISFVMPGSTQYCHLYAEIDLSVVPNRFEIKATPLSNNTAWSPRQDNLKTIPNGRYQLPLWQVMLTAATITLTDRRAFIEKPLNAVNSDSATNVVAGGSVVTSSVTTSAVSSLFGGFTIPDSSIPSDRVQTVAEVSGQDNGISSTAGTISAGWYEVEIAGAGGGGGGASSNTGGKGGDGGYIKTRFFVPFTAGYKLMPGSRGRGGNPGSGSGTSLTGGAGGGGGSVLDIPQLGIIFIAAGGRGGSGGYNNNNSSTGRFGEGGGGGGYGGGGRGGADGGGRRLSGSGSGGAGGGSNDRSGWGRGGDGGDGGAFSVSVLSGACGYGANAIGTDSGVNGANNLNNTFGGGSSGGNGGSGTSWGSDGSHGYVRLYKLG